MGTATINRTVLKTLVCLWAITLGGCALDTVCDDCRDTMSDVPADTPESMTAPEKKASTPDPEPTWEFGEPIDAAAGEWTWVPFEGTRCMRSDKPAGIAINPAPVDSPNRDKVHIWLEGGGACFSPTTCNPPAAIKTVLQASTGQTAFAAHITGYGESDMMTTIATAKNLDRNHAQNPFQDWNLVMIPYCSGDLHMGKGAVAQNNTYTGYSNITAYLKRIVPTFEGTEEVVLSGTSAGGFGALANFEQVQSAFGKAPVHLLQDSSPYAKGDSMSACVQDRMNSMWQYEHLIPDNCEDCMDPDKGGLTNLHAALMDKYPESRFGLIASTADETLRFFFGETASNCMVPDSSEQVDVIPLPPFFVRTISPQTMSLSMTTLKQDAFDKHDNGAIFLIPTTRHVFLNSMTGTTDGVELADWMWDFVGNTQDWVSHAP